MTQSIRAVVRDGKIELLDKAALPEGSQVLITVLDETRSSSTPQKSLEELGYSADFINVLGSWEGEPLTRPEQPPYQEREEIL